jgi:hypothetical protein
MSWSFASGGLKEVWVELKDNADQTSQCFKDIAVVPLPEWFQLPNTITLDQVDFSAWTARVIERIAEDGGEVDAIPVFLQGSYTLTGDPVRIVLVVSPDPPTKYNLVRIRTNSVQDPAYLDLYAVMESSGLLACAWNTQVEQKVIDALTHPESELAEKIGTTVADALGKAIGVPYVGTAVMTMASIVDCVNEGYRDKLEGYENAQDYLVYLPVGYDFTIKVERGINPCEMQAGVLTFLLCPPQVQGTWNGTISDSLHEIHLDIQEVPTFFSKIFSPGELRVYDSQGHVTGLVDGEVRQEIPDSIYDEENKAVKVFSPSGPLICEVSGTDSGGYSLLTALYQDGKATVFTADDILISTNAVHQYAIDWDALSQGDKGVTAKIDADGDGKFERTVTADAELTQDEFASATKEGGLPFWVWIVVGVAAVLVVGVGAYLVGKRRVAKQ